MENLKDIINEGVINERTSGQSEIWDVIYDMERNRGNIPMKYLLFNLKRVFHNLDNLDLPEFIEDGGMRRLIPALLTAVDLIAKELNLKIS